MKFTPDGVISLKALLSDETLSYKDISTQFATASMVILSRAKLLNLAKQWGFPVRRNGPKLKSRNKIRNGRAPLSSRLSEVEERLQNGRTVKEIAAEFGFKTGAVYYTLHRHDHRLSPETRRILRREAFDSDTDWSDR